jgi:hypothetical protein
VTLASFLAPKGENTEPKEQEPDLQDIINHHTGMVGLEVPEEEATLPAPPTTLAKAIAGLADLTSYLESQEDSTIADGKLLAALTQRLALVSISKRKQTSITAWFGQKLALEDV